MSPGSGLRDAVEAGRASRDLVLSQEERAALEGYLLGCSPNAAVARRARIVLACADEPGARTADVASRLGVSLSQVVTWRTLFHQRRLTALFSRPRAPRRPKADREAVEREAVERVVRLTLETPCPDGKPWSTRRLAQVAGVSHVRVWQIWRTHGIAPGGTAPPPG